MRSTLLALLFEKKSIYGLIAFRILFGLTMAWEVWRYFKYDWIKSYYIDPSFHFHYGGFEWVEPWSGAGMYLHFAFMALLAVLVGVGFLYRISSVLFFFSFSYIFLLEQARYLNHFYLIVLLSFLMIFLPCNRYLSVDSLIWPKIKTSQVSAWSINLVRFQLGIAYFFGGVAKINSDWLKGKPMNDWLSSRTDFPLIGQWFEKDWMIMNMSYGGLLLDLFIVPLLFWKKTRFYAFLAGFLFHSMNDRLFSIGIFPWFMVFATTVFLPSDWAKKLLEHMRSSNVKLITYLLGGVLGTFIANYMHKGDDFVPLLAGFVAGIVLVYLKVDEKSEKLSLQPVEIPEKSNWKWLIAAWVIIQLVVPLRHLFIPGNVNWTEEGHRFSWHMKLRDKSGSCRFVINDPELGGRVTIDPSDYLTRWQYRKMVNRPYMIVQFAQHLDGLLYEIKGKKYDIMVESEVVLNGRKPANMIDPDIAINKQNYSDWSRNNWILLDH